MFIQVGHTCPRSLVVKFAKYEKRGTSFIVNPLQRSKVDEADYDIAFTKEYFDNIRSEAPQKGDVLMRTLIVLSEPKWEVEKEGAVCYLRPVSSNLHCTSFCCYRYSYDNSSRLTSAKAQSPLGLLLEGMNDVTSKSWKKANPNKIIN